MSTGPPFCTPRKAKLTAPKQGIVWDSLQKGDAALKLAGTLRPETLLSSEHACELARRYGGQGVVADLAGSRDCARQVAHDLKDNTPLKLNNPTNTNKFYGSG
ncbi:hypothetical protein GGX14DRAFT_403222 [Mycena pura]|uniref:Uncharacterized protein n=1 Tax=Mycena pura TaxID=153505 RepID=A0AAD6Y1C1_9AGAR|nr:hypothetical protein GGX14DRAFT_403222 [Mycena pura]